MRKIARDNNVPLKVVWKSGRVNDLADHTLDACAPNIKRGMAVLCMNHDGKQLAYCIPVALREGLAPMSVRESPRVLPTASPEGV